MIPGRQLPQFSERARIIRSRPVKSRAFPVGCFLATCAPGAGVWSPGERSLSPVHELAHRGRHPEAAQLRPAGPSDSGTRCRPRRAAPEGAQGEVPVRERAHHGRELLSCPSRRARGPGARAAPRGPPAPPAPPRPRAAPRGRRRARAPAAAGGAAAPSRSTSAQAISSRRRAGRRREGGTSRSRPALRASHRDASGQRRQSGAGLRHTVAPSSMSAWLKSPGRCGPRPPSAPGTTSAARRHSRPRVAVSAGSPSTRKRRESTRAAFPSTAAAGTAKAMLATAPAVYGPKPGSARRASTEAGSPPWRRSASRAAASRFRHRA